MPTLDALRLLYGDGPQIAMQEARYEKLAERFEGLYGKADNMRLFSAPGRAEIGGNHTDHQLGRVLAASVNVDTIAAVAANGEMLIRVNSEGYLPIEVDLRDLTVDPSAYGTTASIIRGCAARMQALGYEVNGFNAAVTSNVLGGSGLSSSAAFEVLVCAIFDGLFNGWRMSAVERAQVSQYAENEYFGKPSGLMDQMASSVGGIITIDFENVKDPAVSALSYDFEAKGFAVAVVNTGGSHDDLTPAYAAIRQEMEQVAAHFGQKQLRTVPADTFDTAIPELRGKVSDRALLRALHFFDEDARVPQMVAALEANDLEAFFALIIASGDSSWELLQNVWASAEEQPIALALELSRRMLRGKGAWRVHGGGFAGTILAFVPTGEYDAYAARMDAVFGAGACSRLRIRPVGAYAFDS